MLSHLGYMSRLFNLFFNGFKEFSLLLWCFLFIYRYKKEVVGGLFSFLGMTCAARVLRARVCVSVCACVVWCGVYWMCRICSRTRTVSTSLFRGSKRSLHPLVKQFVFTPELF